MTSNPKFTALIERRRLRTALGWMLASVALLAASFSFQAAHAAPAPVSNLPDLPGTEVVLVVQSTANPTLESAPAAGGALFSPFAMAPAKPARRESETASYWSTGNADLTFSVAAAVAAVAAFAYLLRRASS